MIDQVGNDVRLRLLIQPQASRNEIVGPHGDALKIRIQAPPLDGRANDELIAFLAKTLGLPKKRLHILKGETDKSKTILITDSEASAVKARLGL